MLDLEDIFGEGGPLQRALPGFNLRRQQILMAERIAAALVGREILTVEAGTGTGKTFAYLVPALLSGKRVLLSTGTRTLQDQLFAKDLPLLGAALGRPAKTALLKGRTNYLCRQRLEQTDGNERDGMLERIRSWSRTTRSGDLAEVSGLADSHPVWGQVTSTRDNCLGARCPELAACHVALARRQALDADIVIVNHHLLLADLALKQDGFGDLLGAADAIILDEAHQIPDLAAQFFGAHVSSRRIDSLLRDVQAELARPRALARQGQEQALSAMRGVHSSIGRLFDLAPGREGTVAWSDAHSPIAAAVADLSRAVAMLAEALRPAEEDTAASVLAERATELAASLDRIGAFAEIEGARSLEVGAGAAETGARKDERPRKRFDLTLLPFDIAARFQALIEAHPCSWVFTSATLSLGEDFSPFTSRLGLEGGATLKIDSPFDYPRQSVLYLPRDMPLPASPQFLPAVMEVAHELIEASRGGAFILFTSHRALAGAASLWRQRHPRGSGHHLLVQGEAPREQLLREFRDDGGAVLLGTTSFWEGVDVKGHALRLVVIEKLPFASPDDPLVRARIEHLEACGRSAFREYQLPEAALALKQGVGRLIRSEEDFGVVAICDPRLTARSYGKVFLQALPPMSVSRDREEVQGFLSRHAPPQAPRRSDAAP